MNIAGKNFIGNEPSAMGASAFQAMNPAAAQPIEPIFYDATAAEIDAAIQKAETAFPAYSKTSGHERAAFLDAVADEIMAFGDVLIERCMRETGLPAARLTGERGRTVNQLKMFASLLRDGSWVDARIETAEPQRQPVPKPDIRSLQRALGPVGVFGAGNFPLAFSVAGGDTASALAAGCTVVVKAHPAHPGTSELVAAAMVNAVKKACMPDGTFSLLHGLSAAVGMGIVNHPAIKAIGFTGSFRGGKALFDVAVRRREPIPVYAEMSSVNPVFILPGALRERSADIANALTGSITLGAGQFCTNPGLVCLESSADAIGFLKTMADYFRRSPAGVMLTSAIKSGYENGVEQLGAKAGVQLMAQGAALGDGFRGVPALLSTEAGAFLADASLQDEVFGPSTLAVTAADKSQLLDVANNLRGHLTATLHATPADLKNYADLVAILERKVGRLIMNGYPTGVEVCHSMIHGGPFPATTDCHFTSVGTAAIYRFTRPICYQDFPDELLPDELKESNPLHIWRIVNGEQIR